MGEIEINIPTGNGFGSIAITIEVDELVRQLSTGELRELLDAIGKEAVVNHFGIIEEEDDA